MKTKAVDHSERSQPKPLAALPDHQIDTADIPEASPDKWRYARRPGRGQTRVLPVAIDADIAEWFRKQHGENCEAAMTQALREYILATAAAKTSRT